MMENFRYSIEGGAISGGQDFTALLPTGALAESFFVHVTDPTAVDETAAPALRLAAYPNPFNPRATLFFHLPTAARVSLNIYDVAGRHVATLLGGNTLAAGDQRLVWEGRNDAGRIQPSGIYLARLLTEDGFSAERHLVLLR